MVDFDVDLVVPFVDNKDPVWRQCYLDFCALNNEFARIQEMVGARFDDFGFFEYSLKLIDKFMPWIRNIYLIVSNPEQVPDYINKKKTKIVLHKDIIPAQYLPTFNSTTIEMFIPNIKGLSEHFIYTNDDMYPVAPLTKDDFFTEDGKIKMNFSGRDIRHNSKQFRQVCLRCFQHVAEVLGYRHDDYTYLKPNHSMTPMVKSHCIECLEKLAPHIYPNIWAFRTEYQHNQYIYPLYEYLINNREEGPIRFLYTSLKHSADEIAANLTSGAYQIICLNDVSLPDRSALQIEKIKQAFEYLLKN
jgi:hypothetical protein